ncbi:hypothetical protein ACFYPZ_37585 [Streptomyces sp. NPDC005506]|uniref:hypothetical protein n=1 Tax=unclassified Streptomyces TaxID=2593676 RepID=UPI0036BB2E4D
MLIWDSVRPYLTRPLPDFIAANEDWFTVVRLPTHPLNPTEGVRSLVKRDIGNLAAANLGEITRAVKYQLKQIQ